MFTLLFFRPGIVVLDHESMVGIATSGILYMSAIWFYLQALKTEEASTIAPFFQAAGVFLVPLGFHAYFLIAGLVSSAILDPPFLLVVSIVMSIIALGLYRDALNYWYRSNRESK